MPPLPPPPIADGVIAIDPNGFMIDVPLGFVAPDLLSVAGVGFQ